MSKMRTGGLVATLVGGFALTSCEMAYSGEVPPEEKRLEDIRQTSVIDLSTEDVSLLLAQGNVRLIDVRRDDEVAKGIIPGAEQIMLDQFDPASLDLSDDRKVVIYCRSGRRSGIAAERIADFTGKPAHHLKGGILAWQEAGQPFSTEPAEVERSTGSFTLADDWMITADGVRDVVEGASDAQIIDARPLAFLQGKKKHPAARSAGTIEGAANVVHSTWFTGDGNRRIASVEDVIRLAREAGVEDGSSRPLASFCNTGHWAATNWFALSEIAGIDNVKLYPESMVGWTAGGNPVEVRE